MLTDDFLGTVLLDAFRALIPTADIAVRVDHIEGVVGHALHQQPELFFLLPQTIFGRLALGEVARDLGKADEPAVRRTDRIDHHMSPEPAAVLADTPAFVLELAFAGRDFKRARRKPGLAILLAIELREMTSDDLVVRVALEALRARIPARHPSFRVEHVNGVVGNRFHQKPVTPVRGQGGIEPVRCLQSGIFKGHSI